jgi:hypothetical protein
MVRDTLAAVSLCINRVVLLVMVVDVVVDFWNAATTMWAKEPPPMKHATTIM